MAWPGKQVVYECNNLLLFRKASRLQCEPDPIAPLWKMWQMRVAGGLSSQSPLPCLPLIPHTHTPTTPPRTPTTPPRTPTTPPHTPTTPPHTPMSYDTPHTPMSYAIPAHSLCHSTHTLPCHSTLSLSRTQVLHVCTPTSIWNTLLPYALYQFHLPPAPFSPLPSPPPSPPAHLLGTVRAR